MFYLCAVIWKYGKTNRRRTALSESGRENQEGNPGISVDSRRRQNIDRSVGRKGFTGIGRILGTSFPYLPAPILVGGAAQYDIPFVLHETSFDASTDKRKSPCFLCSWMRRKALFEIAKAHGCNKIALGHHQDDILETLLMNLTHQGAFGTMPPKLKMSKFEMEIIRPLCLVSEKELTAVAAWRSYRKQIKNCPYETASSRSDMKELLRRMEEINPEARYSLWGSMTNIQTDYLPQKNKQ